MDLRKLKKIQFYFENCELVTFDAKYVLDIKFELEKDNGIDYKCNDFYLRLSKFAPKKQKKYSFWNNLTEKYNNIFDRILKYYDVTWIYLFFNEKIEFDGKKTNCVYFTIPYDNNFFKIVKQEPEKRYYLDDEGNFIINSTYLSFDEYSDETKNRLLIHRNISFNDRRKAQYLRDTEYKKMISFISEMKDFPSKSISKETFIFMCNIIAHLGLRYNEARTIKVNSITSEIYSYSDKKYYYFNINDLYSKNKIRSLKEPYKRKVYLYDYIKDEIDKYIIRKELKNDDYLFIDDNRKVISKERFYVLFDRIINEMNKLNLFKEEYKHVCLSQTSYFHSFRYEKFGYKSSSEKS